MKKKEYYPLSITQIGYRKLLRIMKISFFLLFVSCLQTFALIPDNHSVRLSMNVENDNTSKQDNPVTGKITDENGVPLIGVNITVKGTLIGTISDANGNFSLNLPENADILVFSFIGMKTQEVSIGNRTVIDITMSMESVGISEVVAIGYSSRMFSAIQFGICRIRCRTERCHFKQRCQFASGKSSRGGYFK